MREAKERGAVRRLLVFALIIGLFSLISCHKYTATPSTAVVCTTTTSTTSTTSSSSSCTDPVTGITVTIAPATISLNVATSTQFLVAVSGGTNVVVTWQVNKITGGNDTVGRIDSNGLYRAPATVPSPATVNVSAVSFEDSKVSATSATTILPPPQVTVAPTSVTLSAGTANTKTFTSTVTGAPTTNVDWQVNSVLGGNATFGTIDANGVYTAPLTPPIGTTVIVTAVSRDFPLSSANATVTISGYSTSSFQGPFAFSMSGSIASGAFFRAGSFVADGAGHLTGGLEDINDASGPTTAPISFAGTYTIAADGRGTMQFNDGRTPASFHFVLVNNNQLQIIGFDSAGTATGQANLQDVSAFSASGLFGAYIFDFVGVNSSSKLLSQIGEFTADGRGGIANGLVDINDGGVVTPAPVSFSGSYTSDPNTPNTLHSNGRMKATLHYPSGDRNFFFYVVSRGSAKFVGIDPQTSAGAVTGTTSPQAPNTTFDQTSFNGNFAFLLTGSGPGGTIATAGSFAADGNGGLTAGVVDENINGTPTPNVAFSSGSYTVASNGRGTATFVAGSHTYDLVFYLGATGNAVLQEIDSGRTSDGSFVQQLSSAFSLASIRGAYVIDSSGLSGSSAQVFLGQLTSDGTGAIPSGAIDINTAGTLIAGEPVIGTYSAPASNGRGALTLNPSTDNRNFAVYVVNSTQVIVVGIDSGSVAAGALFRQF
jgi:hypothetical protein